VCECASEEYDVLILRSAIDSYDRNKCREDIQEYWKASRTL
jgi:hypothetical protein